MKLSISLLAIALTLLYGCFYYIFPATLLEWEATKQWNRAEITLAFTLAIATSALFSPISGHFIDNGKAAITITSGVLLGGILLFLLRFNVSLIEFYLIWIGIGIAMSTCLYEPVFAFIIKYRGDSAKADITTITLVAGFASTLCFPSVIYGLTHFDLAYIFSFASVLILGFVPLIYFACQHIQKHAVNTQIHTESESITQPETPHQILQQPAFWLLAGSFSLLGLVHAVIISHLLPILSERDLALDDAVLIVSLIGPMQVLGRIISIFMGKRFNLTSLTLICFIGLCLALLTLMIAGKNLSLLTLFVFFQGASYGVVSIMKPLVIKHFMGKRSMGVISGMIALPYLLCSALAPYLGSIIWQKSGYSTLLLLLVLISAVGLINFALLISKQVQKEPLTSP
ncbi:MFS transporter [Psychromonas sp.]|nr:MFS transporter [Psychromonas sp.]